MAKRKMNQDFMKNLLLGIIIILALHILQTLVYKFIGYDLWDILKVKKEEFFILKYSTNQLIEEKKKLMRDYKQIEIEINYLKTEIDDLSDERRSILIQEINYNNKKGLSLINNKLIEKIKQLKEKQIQKSRIEKRIGYIKNIQKKRYYSNNKKKLQQLSISPKDHCNKCLNYIESNLS